MRASRSAGTSAAKALARSASPSATNSSSAGVRNTSGQNSGVPGRLLRTRCRGEFAACARPLLLGIEGVDIGDLAGLGKVQLLARKPLVEKPDTPRVAAGRRGADQRLDGLRACGVEQALEHREIEALRILRAKVRWPSSVAAGAWRGVSSRQPSRSMVLCRSPMAHRVRGMGTGERSRRRSGRHSRPASPAPAGAVREKPSPALKNDGCRALP